MYSFFWLIPSVCILCADISEHTISSIFIDTPPMKMELTECSEMSAHKMQTPGDNPTKKEHNIQNMAKV